MDPSYRGETPHDESGYHYPPAQWGSPRPHGRREARERYDTPGSGSHDTFDMSELYMFDADTGAGDGGAEQHYDTYDYGR